MSTSRHGHGHRGTEFLAELTRSGEAGESAESLDLRGKVAGIRDQSGIKKNAVIDFKGNCVESTTQFTIDYKGWIDWKAKSNPKRDPEIYRVRTADDAFDRVVESYNVEDALTKHRYGIFRQLNRVSYRNRGQKHDPGEDYMSNMGYAADGQPEQILSGTGVLATFPYDSATGLMIRKRLIHQNVRRVVEDTQYSHDAMHGVIQSNDAAQPVSYFNNTVVDARCSYTYDTIGRLSSAQGREDADSDRRGNSSVGIPSDSTRIYRYTEEYDYDDADNITRVKHHAGLKGQMWVRSYAYEEESLTYGDASNTGFAGSVISGGGMHSMSWDPLNRLKSCSRQIKKRGTPETTWYVYNSEGERVRKVTERASSGSDDPRKLKETLFFPNLHIYKCKTGDGSGYSKNKRYHLIHSAEQRLIAIAEEDMALSSESTLLVRYHMSDKLELDQAGLVITYEEYSPFDSSSFSLRRSKHEASRKYRFASYERDKEPGLYYCNARYYAPWLGRWISTNPVGTKDGLNLYCYCGNDPVNYVDPTGTTGLFRAMRIAALPMFKTAMRRNEVTKMSPVFEPYQRSWVSEIFKPKLGSEPASLDDPEFLTEGQKLRKLQDELAQLYEVVQRPLGPMDPKLVREMGASTKEEYLTELAKEGLILGGKTLVGYGAVAIATRIPLLCMSSPLGIGAGIVYGVGVNYVTDAAAEKFRKRMAGPNEHAQKEAQAHVETISKLWQGPWECAKGVAEDTLMSYL